VPTGAAHLVSIKQLQAVAEQHVILDHLLRLLFHLAVKEAA